MMEIRVLKRSDDFIAHDLQDSRRWARGKTRSEAVGELIRIWGDKLGISLHYEDTEVTRRG